MGKEKFSRITSPEKQRDMQLLIHDLLLDMEDCCSYLVDAFTVSVIRTRNARKATVNLTHKLKEFRAKSCEIMLNKKQ